MGVVMPLNLCTPEPTQYDPMSIHVYKNSIPRIINVYLELIIIDRPRAVAVSDREALYTIVGIPHTTRDHYYQIEILWLLKINLFINKKIVTKKYKTLNGQNYQIET